MADTLLFRGGSSADITASTVQSRELVIDTDTDQIVSGASKKKTVMEDSSGNISIDGTATFAGGISGGLSTATSLTLSANTSNRTGGGFIGLTGRDDPQTTPGTDNSSVIIDGGKVAANSDGAIHLKTGAGNTSLERLIVNSSGNVLMGGTLPASPNISLNANGSAEFASRVDGVRNAAGDYDPTNANLSNTLFYLKNQDNSADSCAGLGFSIGLSGTAQGAINLISESGGTASAFAFQQRTPSATIIETLRINSTGNVLIGGTLPSSPNISLNANGDAQYSGKIGINRVPSTVTWLGIDIPDVASNYGVYVRTATTSATNRYAFATGNRGSTGATGIWYTQGDLKIGTNLDSPASVEKISLNANGSAGFAGDITCTDNSKGLILKSPDGTSFRLSVANDGTLSASSI